LEILENRRIVPGTVKCKPQNIFHETKRLQKTQIEIKNCFENIIGCQRGDLPKREYLQVYSMMPGLMPSGRLAYWSHWS
jgi:hypothetical protein